MWKFYLINASGYPMKDLKKNTILNAATKIFAEKGYQYATIAEVAKEAGVSTGLVYSYFKNKLDLLLSVVLLFRS